MRDKEQEHIWLPSELFIESGHSCENSWLAAVLSLCLSEQKNLKRQEAAGAGMFSLI